MLGKILIYIKDYVYMNEYNSKLNFMYSFLFSEMPAVLKFIIGRAKFLLHFLIFREV